MLLPGETWRTFQNCVGIRSYSSGCSYHLIFRKNIMSAIKKALRSSMRRKRYAVFEQKENDYIHTPTFKRSLSNPEETVSSDPSQQFEQDKQRSAVFRRGSQVTRSFRDAVGVIRQKIRTSTRRLAPLQERNNTTTTPNRRKSTSEVDIYSPFHIETPTRSGRVSRRSNIKTCVSMETPTRLRREVEALTANMQALASLSPNTLRDRHSSKRKSPAATLTNGSLRTPKQARRRIDSNTK